MNLLVGLSLRDKSKDCLKGFGCFFGILLLLVGIIFFIINIVGLSREIRFRRNCIETNTTLTNVHAESIFLIPFTSVDFHYIVEDEIFETRKIYMGWLRFVGLVRSVQEETTICYSPDEPSQIAYKSWSWFLLGTLENIIYFAIGIIIIMAINKYGKRDKYIKASMVMNKKCK